MAHITQEPVLHIVAGLTLVTLVVLTLPFLVKRIEHNLELFFLVMGGVAVTISGLWNWGIIVEALIAPLVIGTIPVGIFQVVLVFGLLLHYFSKTVSALIISIAGKLGPKVFIFLLIAVIGLFSSVISVIVAAVILSEIIEVLPMQKVDKIKLAVVSCFAAGLGAGLTPVGEPLSTILVRKLEGEPHYAGFLFPLQHLGIYIIPGVIGIAIFGAIYVGRKMSPKDDIVKSGYTETLKGVIIRAVKVYAFIAALILLGEGLKPLVIWYITKLSPWELYWINITSAILDNATLTAVEIGPAMALSQIVSAILALLVSGGMLIPGNIPNIVSAARLRISMKEWARIGIPMGIIIMAIYFIVLIPTFI